MDMLNDPMEWHVPTFQEFESANIPEELFRSPPAMPQTQPRRRPYTETEWTTIRPLFTRLYIDEDRTLKDVIWHLKSHHNFHPTEQMCKKRIPVWGLSKNTKAKDKVAALERLARGYCPTTVCQQVPPHKLIRHWKSRSKHAVNDTRPMMVTKTKWRATNGSYLPVVILRLSTFDTPTAASLTPKVTRSLALPGDYTDVDLVLRAAKRMMVTTNREEIEVQTSLYVNITKLLTDGFRFWGARAFTQARSALSSAADIVAQNLRRKIGLHVEIITLWFSPEWLRLKHLSIFSSFLGFIVHATSGYLGPMHPWTTLAQHLQKTRCKHVHLRMWDCIVDGTNVSAGGIAFWWILMQARIECYRWAGIYELALKYCQEAADTARKSNMFTLSIKIGYLWTLGMIYLEQQRGLEARSTFERLVDAAQADVERYWYHVSIALRCLAIIHEDCGELDQAQERYRQRLELCLKIAGIEDTKTVEALTDLLRFCQNHNLHDESIRVKRQYADAYNYLEDISEGLWNLNINDDSAVVEETSVESEQDVMASNVSGFICQSDSNIQ